MSASLIIIWVVAPFFWPGETFMNGIKIAWQNFYITMPRILVALMVSGFVSTIIPADLVAAWLGRESGLKGILIGSLLGGFTPGGPIISFPIVLVLLSKGAGIPSVIAFLTAWSVFAFHRIITYEIPLMGYRFMLVRILSSVILPPLAGILAGLVETNPAAGHFVGL